MIDIGKDLQNAFDEGYKQGRYDEKVETEMSSPKWIPVNDMLPSRSGMFLVTVSEKYGFPSTVWRVMFDIKLSKWFVYGEEFDTDITDDVLAWMPLPEPYREDGE